MNSLAALFEYRDTFLAGLLNTVSLVALCALFSLPLGCLGAIALIEAPTALGRTARELVDLLRCVPFLLLAYVVYYGLPEVGLRFDAWRAGLAALLIYNTAYVVEILRSAILALPADQTEAGRAFGFTRARFYRRIVLPQIVVASAPMLGNQLVVMVKETALLMIITVQEVTFAANFVSQQTFSPFAPFALAVALYWAICLVIEAAMRALGRSRNLSDG
jgi:polar amino acid transport system permease protein